MTDTSNIEILECPYCLARCQFNLIEESFTKREVDDSYHLVYRCASCSGLIMTIWKDPYDNDFNGMCIDNNNVLYKSEYKLDTYYPNSTPNEWDPRVDLSLITNDKVKNCFEESISCYNYKLYNACMITARGAIEQDMLDKKIEGGNLYEKIENTGISTKFKNLLHKVRDIGNHGAHPDFHLFDDDGNEIKSKEKIAELSLELLDRYFMDAYEIDELIKKAPKRKKN